MRKMLVGVAVVVGVCAAGTGVARAGFEPRAVSCSGHITIDQVAQTGTNGSFVYSIQLRNEKGEPVSGTVDFGGFPKNVAVFSAQLPSVPLAKYEVKQIKFADGSNDQIGNHTVARLYDSKGNATGPYVLVKSCKM